MLFTGLYYKSEITPIQIDDKSKLNKIVGQRTKNGKNQVLVKNSGNSKPKWTNLTDFLSK